MEKLLSTILAFVLTISLLAACGGAGGKSGSGSSNEAGSGNSSGESAAPDADNSESTAPAKMPGNDKSGEARTPDVTANPGDVVFDNDVVTIFYTKTTSDSISMDICLECKNNSDQEITAWTDGLVINGTGVGIGVIFSNIPPGKSDDNYVIMLTHQNLESEGFSAEDIETVQVTFRVESLENGDVLFEGTALLNLGAVKE